MASSSSSSVLATQGTLNDLADKFGGRTPVRIHFLDNSSKMFLLDQETLTKDLIQTILDKFAVQESHAFVDYFGIFESLDGHNIGASLNPEDRVVEHVKKWSTGAAEGGGTNDQGKLVFMIRLFMPCLWGLEYKDRVAQRLAKPSSMISVDLYLESSTVRDESLIHLQYIQALYHIITNQYPTTEEPALTLGAYHFIFKFGNYKSDVHKLGFLGTRIVEFVPIKLLRLHDFEEWETRLLDHLKDFTAHDHQKSVQRLYMEDVYKMPIYGCSFFRCNQKGAHSLPENIILGIQFDGIKLFDKNRNLLTSFRIEEVLRWGFKPSIMFYFEVRPSLDLDGTLEFDSADGKIISDLLTDYALAFIQEKTHEDERHLGDPSPTGELPIPPSSSPRQEIVSNTDEMEPSSDIDSEDEMHELEHDAATRIQSRFRGFSLRNEWQKEDAAILIQATFRGHKGRIEVSNMIEKMIEDGHFDDAED